LADLQWLFSVMIGKTLGPL